MTDAYNLLYFISQPQGMLDATISKEITDQGTYILIELPTRVFLLQS